MNSESGGYTSNAYTRSFCLNLMSGLLNQKKLIPLKWMASQLAIELTLADIGESFVWAFQQPPVAPLSTQPGTFEGTITYTQPSYQLQNINFISEMVEFDSTVSVF